jgi:hypothetical protein
MGLRVCCGVAVVHPGWVSWRSRFGGLGGDNASGSPLASMRVVEDKRDGGDGECVAGTGERGSRAGACVARAGGVRARGPAMMGRFAPRFICGSLTQQHF